MTADLPTIKDIDRDRTLFVRGESMSPYLKTGDLLVTEKVKTSSLKAGDIIARRDLKDPHPIIHRLIRIKTRDGKTALFTKGDNNLVCDIEFESGSMIERGRYLLRGKRTVDLLSKPQRAKAFLIVMASRLNINMARIRHNLITKAIKPSKAIASFLAFFLPKDTGISRYEDKERKVSFKAFAGRIYFANAWIEDAGNALTVRWMIRYPFYHTAHGEKFLEFLIDHARQLKKSCIIFKNLPKESTLYGKLYRKYPLGLSFIKDSGEAIISFKSTL